MNIILSVLIECEGETNGYFTINYSDKTTRCGWSCDQDDIEMDDGKPLDRDEHDFLMNLWHEMDIDLDYEGRTFATFTYDGTKFVCSDCYEEMAY